MFSGNYRRFTRDWFRRTSTSYVPSTSGKQMSEHLHDILRTLPGTEMGLVFNNDQQISTEDPGRPRGSARRVAKRIGATLLGAGIGLSCWFAWEVTTYNPPVDSYGFGSKLTLDDGRDVSYSIYGPRNAKNFIFCFHGTGGSRLDLAAIGLDDEQLFQRNSVQIIALDRPGYGSSSDLPGRKLLDYAADVVEIANKLKIDKFSIIGISGGGIYALACSYMLPKIASGRLLNVGLVASEGPWSATDFPLKSKNLGLTLEYPALMTAMYKLLRYTLFEWEGYASEMKKRMTESKNLDAIMLAKANPTPGQLVLASKEGLRKTVAGAVRDIQLQHKEPWGFDLSEIKHDKMFLWHGVNDTIVPIQVAEYTCRKVPTVRCFFEEQVGHTVILPKFEEILSTILKGRSPRTCDGPVCKV